MTTKLGQMIFMKVKGHQRSSGVARAFPGGRLAHPEGQNEEENKLSLRKNKKICSKFEEKMRKVEFLPTRDCEAGYGPAEVTCGKLCSMATKIGQKNP